MGSGLWSPGAAQADLPSPPSFCCLLSAQKERLQLSNLSCFSCCLEIRASHFKQILSDFIWAVAFHASNESCSLNQSCHTRRRFLPWSTCFFTPGQGFSFCGISTGTPGMVWMVPWEKKSIFNRESLPETPGWNLWSLEITFYVCRRVSTCPLRSKYAQGWRKPHPDVPKLLQLIFYHR